MAQFKVQWKTPRRTPGDFNLQSTVIEAESALDAVYHVGKRQGMFGARDVTVEVLPNYGDGLYLDSFGNRPLLYNGMWMSWRSESSMWMKFAGTPCNPIYIGPLPNEF